ncbi:MAG: SDR family oxidoreductase [Gammaproteobacteria bacterium]|nr:SDR family oxidoreductase [Gammaproteobacteria bacterium]MDH3411847.1 SDR family oxidoreductase [Gammaproteobacteria bacterium]
MSQGTRQLEGKVALLTGAVRRNGRAMARALAREGANIVINTRASAEEAESTVAEIKNLGVDAVAHLADVTDEKAVADMIEAVISRFGRLDILINNAANRAQSPFLDISYAQWHSIISIILDGAFLCSRAALPHMIAAGGGRIVNIGGVSGHAGAIERAHVVTAKAGLVGLTKALAVEFAQKGITVNCVVPGKIGGERPKSAGESPPLVGGKGPLVGREGTFEEVAAIVLTLCLPTGAFVTGQAIHVNGGMYMP